MTTTAARTVGPGLTLAALGIVYGDIGTSPLYAMRESFVGEHGFAVDEANVFGVLSLITWSLVLVVSVKYMAVVLRADNQGEGGLLALAHLVVPADVDTWATRHWVAAGVGVFGAALLFGDGLLTPALSVLSAAEGLRVIAPDLEPAVVPVTIGILIGLFAFQRRGTGHIGRTFGPVMLLWFGSLAALGLVHIADEPLVLRAASPHYAVAFFSRHGVEGTLILGAVFLTVTGAEALYADLGHFGRGPIRRSWFLLAFPALLLNYFGQGALLLSSPEAVDDLFFRMAPKGWAGPLVALATVATIIASQAVISGVFSLAAQAVRADWAPRAVVLHTSADHVGQLYVPAANKALLIGTVALVLVFQSSSSLADAYGIAVSLTMLLTTVLLAIVMRRVWRWSLAATVACTAAFAVVDLTFFAATARKVLEGGWFPLTLAAICFVSMVTWKRGRQVLTRHHHTIRLADLPRGEEVAVILVRDWSQVEVPLADRQDVVLLHLNRCGRPFMRSDPHGVVLGAEGPPRVWACFGFMETPDVPATLRVLADHGELDARFANPRYFVIQESAPVEGRHALSSPIRQVYGLMARLSASVPELAGVPTDQVYPLIPTDRPPGIGAGG